MSETPDYALLDRLGLAQAIFFPRRDRSPAPAGAYDLDLEVAPDTTVGARFYAAGPHLPTVLYFHGNGEVAPDHDDIAGFYRQVGLNLFVAEFRGYGRSSGKPSFAALVNDALPVCKAFHAHLDAAGFASIRFIMGRSLGTHPALEIAAREPARFAGLIVESGAASMRRLAAMAASDPSGEGPTLVETHEAKVRSIGLPALIIHGERDELIPLERAVELHDLLGSTDKELIVIPGAGHNDILWLGLDRYFAAIARFTSGRPG